jgi:hypothetical protein
MRRSTQYDSKADFIQAVTTKEEAKTFFLKHRKGRRLFISADCKLTVGEDSFYPTYLNIPVGLDTLLEKLPDLMPKAFIDKGAVLNIHVYGGCIFVACSSTARPQAGEEKPPLPASPASPPAKSKGKGKKATPAPAEVAGEVVYDASLEEEEKAPEPEDDGLTEILLKDVKKGDYVWRKRDAKTTWKKMHYDASSKKYALADTSDMMKEIFIKGSTKVFIGMTH